MFRDNDLIFTDNVAIRSGNNSTVIDLNKGLRSLELDKARAWGNGNPLYVLIQITETYAGATALGAILRKYATAARGAPEDVATVDFDRAAKRTAGYRTAIYLPPGIDTRFIGIGYTSTGTITAGRISAWLSPTVEAYQTIESGFEVL